MTAFELFEIGLFRRHEAVHQRARQPRIAFNVLILQHDEAVDRIDAGAAKPIGLDLFDICYQFRVGVRRDRDLARLVPAADRRPGTPHAGRAAKAGLRILMISAGTFAGATNPFQLVTT